MADEEPTFNGPEIQGKRATNVAMDVVAGGNVRMHFGGESFAFVLLDPEQSTQLGLMLIQHAVHAALERAKNRIVVPKPILGC